MKSDGQCACGFYLDDGLTWEQARDQCNAHGGRLPEIYSDAENEAIFEWKVKFNIRIFFESLARLFQKS